MENEVRAICERPIYGFRWMAVRRSPAFVEEFDHGHDLGCVCFLPVFAKALATGRLHASQALLKAASLLETASWSCQSELLRRSFFAPALHSVGCRRPGEVRRNRSSNATNAREWLSWVRIASLVTTSFLVSGCWGRGSSSVPNPARPFRPTAGRFFSSTWSIEPS